MVQMSTEACACPTSWDRRSEKFWVIITVFPKTCEKDGKEITYSKPSLSIGNCPRSPGKQIQMATITCPIAHYTPPTPFSAEGTAMVSSWGGR